MVICFYVLLRLISEMTVEENILKKANQKRLLGDLAIEGGNFTTAFFKEVCSFLIGFSYLSVLMHHVLVIVCMHV